MSIYAAWRGASAAAAAAAAAAAVVAAAAPTLHDTLVLLQLCQLVRCAVAKKGELREEFGNAGEYVYGTVWHVRYRMFYATRTYPYKLLPRA